MPNTLAHLGVHTLVGRHLPRFAARQPGDLLWLWLGCVLPDLPWILQRLAKQFIDGEARYDLRLFFVSQATLLGCVVLSAAVSMLARKRLRVFVVLSSSSLVHLLIDAIQIKWGNGPHLLAPFSWWTPSGLVWPESAWTWLAVAIGVAVALYYSRDGLSEPVVLDLSRRSLALFLLLLVAWCVVSRLLAPLAEASDVHGIQTLRDTERRAGKFVELYNAHWLSTEEGLAATQGRLLTMTSEPLVAVNLPLAPPARASVRGRFVDSGTLEVLDFHQHRAARRDLFSYLGLAWVAGLWIVTQRKALARRSPGYSGETDEPPSD